MSDDSMSATVDLGPLEEDFAVLEADLARIAAMPVSLGNAATAALEEMIKTAAADQADSVFGRSFQTALYAVMKDSALTDMHGNMRFNVDQRTLAAHSAPVIRDVVTVVQGQVETFLNGLGSEVAAAAAAAKPIPKDAAPASKPAAPKFKVDLLSLFSGLIESAAKGGKPPKKD